MLSWSHELLSASNGFFITRKRSCQNRKRLKYLVCVYVVESVMRNGISTSIMCHLSGVWEWICVCGVVISIFQARDFPNRDGTDGTVRIVFACNTFDVNSKNNMKFLWLSKIHLNHQLSTITVDQLFRHSKLNQNVCIRICRNIICSRSDNTICPPADNKEYDCAKGTHSLAPSWCDMMRNKISAMPTEFLFTYSRVVLCSACMHVRKYYELATCGDEKYLFINMNMCILCSSPICLSLFLPHTHTSIAKSPYDVA